MTIWTKSKLNDDERIIVQLYFDKMYSFERIKEYFAKIGKKIDEHFIIAVLNKIYKNYEKNSCV